MILTQLKLCIKPYWKIQMEANEVKQFLVHLAECASKITLPGFRTLMDVTDKASDSLFDPVTDIDLRTEKTIADEIKIRFPEHGISGEEYGTLGPQDRWSWIIDPIDGTRSFISGMPTWGTLIGVLFEGKPVYGMMSQPYVGDCFIGGAGISELYNAEGSKVLRAGDTMDLSDSILFSTTPDMFQAGIESDCFTDLVKKVKMTRFGADCYGYCLLASGFVDLVVESNLKYCDIAPLVPIIEASGGVVSHWDGNPVRAGGQVVAASTQKLLEQALELLVTAS